jgi:hypothetical protein
MSDQREDSIELFDIAVAVYGQTEKHRVSKSLDTVVAGRKRPGMRYN